MNTNIRTRTGALAISRRGAWLVPAALALAMLASADVAAVAAPPSTGPELLPFFVGERLVYDVRAGAFGRVGQGAMVVEGPEPVRGRDTYVLKFDFATRVGPVRAVDRTQSWLDPRGMTSLRYYKHERHPLAKHDEYVEIFPDQRRWEAASGRSGSSPGEDPLDELSFIYFVRTLPLTPGSVQQLNRHFESDRNPVVVRVLGRERVRTGAGTFSTVLVEMRVKDPRRYGSEGVIRLNLTDDDCRIPVRIQSSLPVLGALTLDLASHTHPAGHQAGQEP